VAEFDIATLHDKGIAKEKASGCPGAGEMSIVKGFPYYDSNDQRKARDYEKVGI
jgi:hypothetical protein